MGADADTQKLGGSRDGRRERGAGGTRRELEGDVGKIAVGSFGGGREGGVGRTKERNKKRSELHLESG